MRFEEKQHGPNKQNGELQLQYDVQYHGHLVHLDARRDPSLCDWTVTAYIEFSETSWSILWSILLY